MQCYPGQERLMEDRIKLQSEQPLFGLEFVLDTSQI